MRSNARSLAVAMAGLLPAHIQTVKNITPEPIKKLTLMGWEMQQGWELLGSGNVEHSSAYSSLWPHINAYLDDLLISPQKNKKSEVSPRQQTNKE